MIKVPDLFLVFLFASLPILGTNHEVRFPISSARRWGMQLYHTLRQGKNLLVDHQPCGYLSLFLSPPQSSSISPGETVLDG